MYEKYKQAYIVFISLLDQTGKKYLISTCLLILSAVTEGAMILGVMIFIQGLFKNQGDINYSIYSNNINISIELSFILIILMMSISSLTSYYSSKIFFIGFADFEKKVCNSLIKRSYDEILNSNENSSNVGTFALTLLNKHTKVLNESNYYLRYLFESVAYFLAYGILIVVISPLFGSLFLIASIVFIYIIGFFKDNENASENSNSNDSKISEFLYWVIINYKYIISRRIYDEAQRLFSKKISKEINGNIQKYISSDFKRSIALPALLALILFFSFIISRVFKENIESFSIILILIYRVLPRLSYINGQVVHVSQGYNSLNHCLKVLESNNYYFNQIKNNVENVFIEISNDNQNITIQRGKFVSIKGPSGSGKTSFIDAIAGIRGNSKYNIKLKADLNFLYYDQSFYSKLPGSVEEFINLYNIENLKIKEKEIFLMYLEKLGLSISKGNLDLYSGGEKQRIALALVLSKSADIILLDEPTSALDGVNEVIFIKLLKAKIAQENSTVIIATHSEEIINSSDVVIEIK